MTHIFVMFKKFRICSYRKIDISIDANIGFFRYKFFYDLTVIYDYLSWEKYYMVSFYIIV